MNGVQGPMAPGGVRRGGAPAIAQINLGEMYLLGLGVPRDPVRAHLFLTLAARQGRAWARDRLGALARGMTADQRDLARELLRDWVARE